MAIVQKEPRAEACKAALETENEILMSAGTLAELLVVSAGRQIIGEVDRFLDRFDLDIVAVTSERARLVGATYRQWGVDFTRRALILAIALPTRWRRSAAVHCSMSATISLGPMSPAHCEAE
jgi:uncharacterized protein with PIN domain